MIAGVGHREREMATKRTRRPRGRQGITPGALAAWRAGDKHALHRELAIKPWECSPFNADGPCPGFEKEQGRAEFWAKAVEQRRALVELAGSPGRVGRHGKPLGPATADDEASNVR